ncbi:MAG: TetR/AcrR family transcriptional regulator [Nocardioidaceae bacterium]
MATRNRTSTKRRAALSRDLVLQTAVDTADQNGIASVTMRRLAQLLGVEPMSLYHHVADKNDLLDGMVDVVVKEINARVTVDKTPRNLGGRWKQAVRQRILTARGVLLRHPWAPGAMETRSTMSPPVLQYYDALTQLLRDGGLSVSLVHHALHALSSRALGFSQELFRPDDDEGDEPDPDIAAIIDGQMAEQYPYITEIAVIESRGHDDDSTLGWCDDQVEFEFGLDLILDGLERLHNATAKVVPQPKRGPT